MNRHESLKEFVSYYVGTSGAVIVHVYLGIGLLCAVATFISGIYFYTWGPFQCNGGFIACAFASAMGLLFNSIFSALRIVLWPIGVYTVITTDLSLWEWINYVWYPEE